MITADTAKQIKSLYESNPKMGYRTVAKQYGVHWKTVYNIIKKGTYHKVPSERFWEKVNIKRENDCWLWQASTSTQGYGHIGWNKKVVEAHRVAYFLATGIWPGKKHVLHECDTPLCCNPRHLSLGSHQDNMRDMKNKGRVSKHGRKLSMAQAEEIRQKYKPYVYTNKMLQKEYGLSKSTIGNIILKRSHSV